MSWIISTVELNPRRTLYWRGILAGTLWTENKDQALLFDRKIDASICWDNIRANGWYNPANPLSIEQSL